ncbi:MAG: MFS transporter [Betaproteobacteria bacterium]
MTETPHGRPLSLLLNVGHAIDHMLLLVFATAVGAIAADFGFARWEDLMPYSVGAFFLFGIGSIASGRLGDLWGRRQMMIVFFIGIGASALLVAAMQTAWQLAIALTVLGAFSSIYHPVGIPMLVQNAKNPGLTIGINGLAGNMGIAVAALATGFLVKLIGWRAAFVVPGLVSIGCGLLFVFVAPTESAPPAKRVARQTATTRGTVARLLAVMTLAAVSASFVFNLTTNGNAQLLQERLHGIVEDPATLGSLLAVVYAVAAFAQVIVGKLTDHFPIKRIYLVVVLGQIPLFALAAYAEGWWLWGLQLAFMAFTFGAIPFTDAMVVRYIDDRMRSRVSGMRIAISFGISSLAVYMLGPVVKNAGFKVLLIGLACIAVCSVVFVAMLPQEERAARN